MTFVCIQRNLSTENFFNYTTVDADKFFVNKKFLYNTYCVCIIETPSTTLGNNTEKKLTHIIWISKPFWYQYFWL